MTEPIQHSSPSVNVPNSSSGRSALEVARDAAHRAGAVIVQRLHTPKEISFKGPSNPVTDVDLKAERAALQLLQYEYPDFGILSEESEPIPTKSGYTWVIDPLDGTRNYVHGLPHVAVVVALALNGAILVGVTYDPIRGEVFSAEAGKGAFLNDAPIRVSAKDEISECLLGFDMGYADQSAGRALDMVRSLWPGLQSIRTMGSSALGLAYAACGRLDIYFHHHLSPWDVASGLLLVSEAGGRTVDRHGNPASLENASVIASSSHLISRFLAATEGLDWRM